MSALEKLDVHPGTYDGIDIIPQKRDLELEQKRNQIFEKKKIAEDVPMTSEGL